MKNEQIISTNAFDAFRTPEGIMIQEKRKAKFLVVLLYLVTGLLAVGFVFVLEAIDIPERGRLRIFIYLKLVLWYGGLFVLAGGLIFLLIAIVIKPKIIIFDHTKKELLRPGKSIPFTEIKNPRIKKGRILNFYIVRFMYTDKGFPNWLFGSQLITKDIREIDLFMTELKALIEKQV